MLVLLCFKMYFTLFLSVGCRDKTNCPHVEPGPRGGNALRKGLSKGSKPVFTRVSEKTTKNSKRLGRQARPRIERSTSCLPVQAQKRSASGGGLSLLDSLFTIT